MNILKRITLILSIGCIALPAQAMDNGDGNQGFFGRIWGAAKEHPVIAASIGIGLCVAGSILKFGWGNKTHTAINAGNIQQVKCQLDCGADIEVKDEWGITPLQRAVGRGRTEIVKLLLEKGANMEVKNDDGETPLHEAASFGRTKIVKLFLDNDANIDIKDNDGCTPLDRAAWERRTETVRCILYHPNFTKKTKDYYTKCKEILDKASDEDKIKYFDTFVGIAVEMHLMEISNLVHNLNFQTNFPETCAILDITNAEQYRQTIMPNAIRAFVIDVSFHEIRHIIPAIIALTKKTSNLGKDIGSMIATQLIPEIVKQKLALARKYLPNESEITLRKEIIDNINRVIAKSPSMQPAK